VVVLLHIYFRYTLQLFLIGLFFGTGFEVLKVVRIHNAIWFRTLYSLVMNVLCPSSQAVKRWNQYALTKTSVPTSQITRSHNLEIYNFESKYSALSMHFITTVFITNELST